jgi:hypothetical protein
LATTNANFKVKNGLDAVSNISTLAGLVVGTSTLPANMQSYLLSTSATNVGLSIRGASGQSANLTEWQNNTPSTVALVTSGGSIFSSANGGFGSTSALSTARLSVTGAASSIGVIVRGNATTPGNLQEWQTSTPTTVASISSGGAFTTTGLTLSSTTSPITLNASVGTSGQVLTSAGAGATPTWTTPSGGSFTGGTLTSNLTLAAGTTSISPLTFQSGTNLTTVTAGVVEYDGTVFYQTSNTTPGRALKNQSYYYIHNASYYVDYSGSGAAQSILGGTTTGITLAAGTTYEFELNVAVQQTYAISNNFTLTHNWQSTTVTGSPVVSYIQIADYGSNTTGFTTAQTNSTVRVTTGGIIVSAAIASGSRYSIYNIKGTIRVTGTGTVKVYPTLAGTASTDNTVIIQSGSRLRLTPIGNGTVTTVGAWA